MKLMPVAGALLVLSAGGVAQSGLLADDPPSRAMAATAAVDRDVEDEKDEDPDGNKKADAAKSAEHRAKRAAQRAFVAAKQDWTACVADAAPSRSDRSGARFDPEAACGAKPHPHDNRPGHDAKAKSKDRGAGHDGRPAWAGGPKRRTAEPPGHSRHA